MKSSLFAAGILSLLVFQGCGTGGSSGGVGLLPPPQAGAKHSTYQPAKPYEPIAPGVSSRTLHSASTGAGHRVELREVIVGPGKRGASVDLKGAAILEVLSGTGSLTYAEKRQDLKPGVALSIPGGQVCTVDNSGETQLSFRIYVVTEE